MGKLKVYGIGNILIDIVSHADDQDLENLGLDKGIMKLVEGEERDRIVEFISSNDSTYCCGGSAPNTIITLAQLGINTALSGKIGRDHFGERYEKQLAQHGVTSFLTSDDGNTGSSIILVSPDSERTMNTSLENNQNYCVNDIQEESIREADYLYFTGYMWDTDSQKEALFKAISIAEEAGTQIVFDAADPFAIKRNAGEFCRLIEEHFDIVLANAEEARLMFGNDDLSECINRLADLCKIAVVKNGAEGSVVKSGNEYYDIPVYKVDAIDTTGAGDIYAGGFLYGICSGLGLEESGHIASKLAAGIVGQMGAQFTMGRLAEIKKSF
ncbi:MAG: adenosine kinase [Spirochaetales bacterium]|uniref:Adenosine kinase n=1 Tax=Candidatus Thalassospirochaeta sargassi TaxID=3119039 RepID=A0AAJ1IH60_9SPIO|nr:adenosine kinase [Spirochaetales bacterium]